MLPVHIKNRTTCDPSTLGTEPYLTHAHFKKRAICYSYGLKKRLLWSEINRSLIQKEAVHVTRLSPNGNEGMANIFPGSTSTAKSFSVDKSISKRPAVPCSEFKVLTNMYVKKL